MFYFRNLDVSNGLSNNFIHSFCEDQQGFIWIGTRDGLVRYDGVSMETFYHDPTNSTSIAGNSISWDIHEDSKGRIWVTLHGRGLSRYDPQTNQFTNFSYANGKFSKQWTNDAERLIFTPGENVLLLCQRGIVKIDKMDNTSILIDLQKKSTVISDPGSLRFGTLHQGRWLWLTSTTGFLCYDLKEKKWENKEQNPRNLKVLNQPWNIHGTEYHKGKLWFSTFYTPKDSPFRYLYSFDIEKNELDSIAVAPDFKKANPFSDQVHAIHIQGDGKIWLGTEGIGLMGLLAYEPKTESWVQYHGDTDWTGSILPGPVRRIFEDSNGNMWIGTQRGVSLMAPDKQYFINYSETKTAKEKTIPLREVKSIAVSKNGDIWLRDDGNGMLQLNDDKTFKRRWRDLPKTSGDYRNYIEPRFVHQNILVFHTWYQGLFSMDLKSERVKSYAPITDVNHPEIRDVFQDSKGNIYAFGWGRFGKLDLKSGQYNFVKMPKNTEGRADMVWSAVEGKNGNIWLALGQNGLVCVNSEEMKIVDSWKRDTSIYAKTPVWDLVYKDGKIYFSFDKLGLGIFNIKTKEVTVFSKKDGLCSDELNGLIMDETKDIWLYSSSGISWFNEQNRSFRTFSEADGMISENAQDAALLPNGNILMVTDRGLVEFDPEKLKELSEVKLPSIRSIQVYDKQINIHQWKKDSSQIIIPHNKNYLRMEFSALEFFDLSKIQFAYRLDGVEQRWNYTKRNPVAVYSQLGGGKYQFCVKRTNIDGAWGPQLCIPIFVTTPFYKRAWFIILTIGLIATISYFIYRWQLKKRLAVLEVRNRLSRDLHDDIGSALSSINIYSSVAQQQLEQDKNETKKLLDRIGSNAQKMMQDMDDIIWAIDPSNDQVEQLAARMREFASPILEAKNIILKLKVEENTKLLKLNMVRRRNLFLIFKEAINNLAKYSEAKRADVQIESKGNMLHMSISDNGKGFDATKKTNRYGLKNMKNRAREINGQAKIKSNTSEGTQVLVKIPIT